MRKWKSGISLIVLVITIMIIIILSASIILTLIKNNPIENAQEISFQNDMAALKEELNTYIHKQISENQGVYELTDLNVTGEKIKEIIPNISDKYIGKISIIDGDLNYIDESNLKEYSWAKEALEGIKANYDKVTSTNENNIKIENAISGKIGSFRIYGNSVQDGTPTPENPVEIESVGDLVTDTNDTNYGKYKIPISVTSKNLFNMKECINESTIIDNGDGSLLVNKYATSTRKKLYQIAPDLKVGDEFTFSINTTGNPIIHLVNSSVNFNISLQNKKMYVATQDMLDSAVYLYNQSSAQGGNDAIIKSIQIELGDKATEYEPYLASTTTNIYLDEPLRKIGNYADYIDFKNRKVVRNIKKYTFNDLKNKTNLRNDIGWSDGYLRPISYINGRKEGNENALSNKLTGINSYIVKSNGFRNIKAHLEIQLALSLFGGKTSDTKEEIYAKINAYLNNNPIDVIYVLSEAEEEIITLPEISTKSGTNVLTIGTNVAPSKVEVIYGKEK